jgi:hypothetical protein
MHRRAREIADPSRMVEIEMSGHDVADVARTVAEVRDLPQRRLGDLEPRPNDRVEQETEPPGFGDILDPEPGVDQDEPVFALDQETVATHRRGRQRRTRAAEQSPAARTQGPAVEVMDAHPLLRRAQTVTERASASTCHHPRGVQSKPAH